MNWLVKLFQKTFVHNIIQVLICIVVLMNIYFMYYQWNTERVTVNKTQILKKLKNSNNVIVDQSEYYQTDQYKDKVYKEQGYAKNGEQVFSLTSTETPLDEDETTYTPTLSFETKSNIDKWFDCLFLGGDRLDSKVYFNCR